MFICLALIIIISIMAFFYGDQMKFQIVLLKYSNTFLFENGLTFIYIPIFMIFSLGLCALMWFQNMAFQSKFASNNNKWDLANSGIYSALNIIQFLWGIQFLRDACNYKIIFQSIFAFLETLLIGIGHSNQKLLHLSVGQSVGIGVAQQADHS